MVPTSFRTRYGKLCFNRLSLRIELTTRRRWQYHSTEMAVLKVLADILLALDFGDLEMLTLLDRLQPSTALTMTGSDDDCKRPMV